MVGAGHETTATALAWALERLLRTPRVLARLPQSIAAGEDDYLDAIVKETLRVRPVITDVGRMLTAPTEIAGYRLPAGTIVMPAIDVVHHRPDLFNEPEEFRPERFLEGEGEGYSWIPFGGGVRRCVGAAFAQYEMRIVLRAIVEYLKTEALDRGLARRVWSPHQDRYLARRPRVCRTSALYGRLPTGLRHGCSEVQRAPRVAMPPGPLVRLYDEHVSARHLDIGVGTGYLLDKCNYPTQSPEITLMDLNPAPLQVAAKRLHRYRPKTHQANALEPFGLPAGTFESVGLNWCCTACPATSQPRASSSTTLGPCLRRAALYSAAPF